MKKLLVAFALAGLASTVSAAGIHVKDAWARATVEGMKMSGAFMQVHNDNTQQDFLIGGSSPVAERLEVHTHINDNGVMRMRQVKDGVPLPSKATAELKPGSYHIMFMGLKRQLKEGETIPVTLKFKHEKTQTINVTVKNVPKPDNAGQHKHNAATHQH